MFYGEWMVGWLGGVCVECGMVGEWVWWVEVVIGSGGRVFSLEMELFFYVDGGDYIGVDCGR